MKLNLFSAVLFLLAAPSFGQTVVINNNQKEDADHDREREEWFNQMHLAVPGTDWRAIDNATREAKYQAYLATRQHKSGIEPLSLPSDTIAGGGLIGYWSERGSNNVCGRMHTADIDFDHNTIYAASAMGNIWKASVDNTSQWTVLNDQRRFGDVKMVRIVTTSKGKRIIVAASGPAMVYYSDDDGATWLSATGLGGPNNWGGFKRAVLAADEKTLLLFGNEWDYTNSKAIATLYRSTNAGTSFTNVGKWDIDISKCDIWVSREVNMLAYFLKGNTLYQLTSGTALTTISTLNYTTDISSVGGLILQGAEKNNVLSLGVLETTNNVSTVNISSNAGASWSATGTFSGAPFGDNSFKMLSSNPKTMAIGTNNAFVSTDNGATWNVINDWAEYYGDETTKLHADIDGIDFITDPAGNETELISTDGGIFQSSDAMTTFQNITLSGIATSQYYSVLTARQIPYYIYGGSQDQGYQRVNDLSSGLLSMTQTLSGDYGHVTSSNNGKSTWCDYPGFAMFYSDAEGSTSNHQWNFQGNNHLWMPPVTADPSNPQAAYIACGGSGNESFIYHLVNGGSSITATPLSFDFSGGNANRNVSAIAFSPITHSNCYVLTNDGEFFVSLNSGSSWTKSNITAPASHYFYGSVILPSAKTQGTLWIAGSGYSNPGVYQSTDNGTTFTAISNGLPKTLVYSLTATDDEKFLFAGTDVGPYVYSFATGQWYDMANGHAPDMVYWSVDYIPALKTVRFGTYGRGIWDFVIGAAPLPRSYTITAPKAGDVIQGNIGSYPIKYTSVNPGSQRKFEFSSDGGTTWAQIFASDSTATTFTWKPVPNLSTNQGKIRISDELGVIGMSGQFTIKAVMTIITPKTGDTILPATKNYVITHTPFEPGTQNTIDFSSDGGKTWNKIIPSDSTPSTYTWATVPNITTTKGVIRIWDKLGVSGTSGIFSIMKGSSPSPAILTLTLGITNNKIASGAQMDISWTTNGIDFGSGFTVEYSTDGMATWRSVQSVAANIMDIKWTTPQGFYPNSYIRVRGTDADKISIMKESGVFTIGDPAGVSENSANELHISNYPNPFSHSTNFSYILAESGLVNLRVFDIMGREVASLITNQIQEQGLHTFDFDASQLPSGNYTYLFTCGAKKVVGEMTMTK